MCHTDIPEIKNSIEFINRKNDQGEDGIRNQRQKNTW